MEENRIDETLPEGVGQENTEPEMDGVQQLILAAASQIEGRLANTLNQAIDGINARIEANAASAIELTANAKLAIDNMPAMIQERVEGQLRVNLKGIVEEIANQFEEKVKKFAGDGTGGMDFLDRAMTHSDKIIGIVNALRAPTTEQAMMNQMTMIFRWHTLLSKLEKGGGSPGDVTDAIANTFAKPQE